MIGQTVAHYRIVEKLGEGGMGVVFRAEDTRLGRQVAIKALAPEFTSDVERRERLRQEARAAASLSHPGIATVFALEEAGDALFIVSEYVRGRNLSAERSDAPLSLDVLLDTAVSIAQALAAAHDRGIVHRDLKPENLMRCEDGGIKILDFGLARLDDRAIGEQPTRPRLTQAGAILGTISYMSPEQLRGQETDFRSDLFSFGTVLYELASGEHPFEGTSPASTIARIQTLDPPPLPERNPLAPAELDRIVAKCLRKDRDARYQSTRDLAVDLEQLRRDVREGRTGVAETALDGAFDEAVASARWWWRFHQGAILAVAISMIYPVWTVRAWMPPPWGVLLFFTFLAGTVVMASLRGHLWFTAQHNPRAIARALRETGGWIRILDRVLAGALLVGAVWIVLDHTWYAALLVSVAIGTLVASGIIEPATTRAAFGRRPSRPRNPGPRSTRKIARS